MTLIAEAERAEDVGDAFGKFKVALDHDQAAEVTALVSELYALGNALREIHIAVSSPEYSHGLRYIQDDLGLVRDSLIFTLDDILSILGKIGNGESYLTAAAYRQTWRDIMYHFEREGWGRLLSRLEKYRLFLLALCNKVRRKATDHERFGDLRVHIRGLLEDQDHSPDRLIGAVHGQSLGPPGSINQRRSHDRVRPPTSPTSSGHNSIPPYAPELSTSSSRTYSTSTNPTSITETDISHWARYVFGDESSTPLPRSSQISRCYGESSSDARSRLDDSDELFEIEFPGGVGLVVRLYLREEDSRVRVLCKWPGRSGEYRYSSLPLNALEFHREGSSLHLCQPRPGSSRREAWAVLQFTTIERLVLLYCTLLALRSQDEGHPIEHIRDHELAGEQELFAGKISDDQFLHALRVYRDPASRGVRLQASIMTGEMKRAPVWTAFITNYLTSPLWRKRVGSKVVCLSELRRHIFSDDYTPHQTRYGDHVLHFTTAEDAEDFVRTIDDLAGVQQQI